MVFSTLTFLCVALPAIFGLYLVMPSMRLKNGLLIIASLLFYAYGEPVYVLLMIASTIANWGFGLLIKRRQVGSVSRKCVLGIAIVVNLATLCVFKYAGMVASTLNLIPSVNLPIPDLALPIGISFYTFQAMSYVIDVYRGDVEGQRSYWKVLLYISFFPQLIAGPIIKYHDIEHELSSRTVTLDGVATGFRRFCFGLGKKVLIANTLAVAVDAIFGADPATINVIAAWIAAVGYLLQIYFDFSAYSDMAIGMAQMFGFHFKENFDYPYRSTTIKEFWRRWHISLSTWFKEYVYIPLGGNRKGRGRTVINKIIVFAICGLWHGASWTFVLWGLLHGFFLLIEEYVPLRKLPKPVGWVYAILVVTVLFVLFRAESLSEAWAITSAMFTGFHFDTASMQLALANLSPLMVTTLFVGLVAMFPIKRVVESWALSLSGAPRLAIQAASYLLGLILLLASMASLSSGGYNPFIYFRF